VNIKDVVGVSINIWNGEEFANVTPFSTGENSIYRVKLSDGSHLDCTPYHKWCIDGEMIETVELSIGDKLDKFKMPVTISGEEDSEIDAYSQGFYSGDGTKNNTRSWVYAPKYSCIKDLKGTFGFEQYHRKSWKPGPMLPKNFVPMENIEYKLKWLAGLLDSDGVVTRDVNGNGFQITSTDLKFLRDLKLMLTTLGVRAKVTSSNVGGYKSLPDGLGGKKYYFCKKTERILIGDMDSYNLMELGLGKYLNRLKHNGVKPQRDAQQFVKVVSVEDLGYREETFCFTEPKTSRGTFNGIVTGQCGEIILRDSGQFCNLTEAVARPNDTKETLTEKVRIASILGTIQSSFTNFKYLRKVWRDNCEEERLLGVSITGIMDCPLLSEVNDDTKALLTHLKQVARATNKEWAKRLGINESAAITTVKPSGTASQLVDSASGIHSRYAHNYIRRVRQDVKDPITQFMIDKGFPYEEDVTNSKSVVFSFPMEAPSNSIVERDRTPIETLEHWKMFKEYYCEHNPSTTVSVPEESWPEVGAWVWNNFDKITGLSFLPEDLGSYKQAPYEKVSVEDLNVLKEKIPSNVDWDGLQKYESEDMTTGSQELACVAGVCAI
jgi:LAGLIDADG-like domain